MDQYFWLNSSAKSTKSRVVLSGLFLSLISESETSRFANLTLFLTLYIVWFLYIYIFLNPTYVLMWKAKADRSIRLSWYIKFSKKYLLALIIFLKNDLAFVNTSAIIRWLPGVTDVPLVLSEQELLTELCQKESCKRWSREDYLVFTFKHSAHSTTSFCAFSSLKYTF